MARVIDPSQKREVCIFPLINPNLEITSMFATFLTSVSTTCVKCNSDTMKILLFEYA